jgi:putative two-component system response regulator
MTDRPNVLVVDDSPESIDVISSILSDEFQVRAAISGPVALVLARKTQPDLILLDVMMPVMTGFEVCRSLKADAQTADIPIIFITTVADAGSETRGLELGAVDYIAKPYVPAIVKRRVRTQISLRRQNVALEERVRERTAELTDTRLEIIRRLGRAAEYRDYETGMHIFRMSHMSRLLAMRIGLAEEEADLLLHAAPLHDVGKIGIPDYVLLKPGPLTSDEMATMRRHVHIGAEIIGEHPSDLLRTARIIALRHHERWDGTGYPDGLREEEIPLSARIVAVADVFDALLSARPYKGAWPLERTVAEMRALSGRAFDPRCLAAFVDGVDAFVEVRAQFGDTVGAVDTQTVPSLSVPD